MAKNIRRTPPPPPIPEDFPPETVDPFAAGAAVSETVRPDTPEAPAETEALPTGADKSRRHTRRTATALTPDMTAAAAAEDKPRLTIHFQPSPRTRFLGGCFALFAGVFLFAVCLSYLFCWWKDYDILSRLRFAELWQPDAPSLNVVGNKMGGFLAYSLMQKGFGLASLLFPCALVLFGLQWLGFRQFPWRRLFFHGVSILLLASLLLGSLPFLQSNRLSILGGEVGFQLSLYLKNLMGGLGFYLLWAFLLICFLAMSHIIAAVPYTPRNISKTPTADLADAPMDAAGTTADETGSSAEAEEPTDMVTGPSVADAKGPEAADTGTRPCPPAHPVHPYVPAELQRPEGITLEVYRRPNEPEQSPRTETSPWPAAPVAPDQARSGLSAPAPETVAATAGLAGMVPMPASAAAAGTIAIQDIPLASQTISTSLNEAFAAAPAAAPADSAAALPTDGNGPDGPTLRIDDIPLAGGAAAAERSPQAPVPPAEEAADADEIGFTVERPAVEEGIAPQTTTSPTRIGLDTPYDPRLDLRDYRFPIIDLLEDFGVQDVQVLDEELEANKNRIVSTLQNYGIHIDSIKATIGPTVTLYEIVPAAGIRISKIKNLEDDIALSLAALGIRIIAPIPGKGTIGIEVPNQNKQIVPMRDMIRSPKFQNEDFALPIALGKTIANETYVTDLAKMPHLLVAGATGQGKSVGLNAIIASLLYKMHPAELKFVMVDPKKVELSLFSKIERHYLAKLPDADEAIITDTRKVVRTLNSLCKEMDNRYDLLKDAGAKNIKEYNKKFIARRLNPENGHRFMPYIVLVIDEFADLIMTAGKEIEMPIARLAQLARAIGIHLVIATQRPSVNIITGTIKANFPARIAFKVSSKTDSRTILDGSGADQLIGRGDMLLSTGNDLVRIQCAYIDTPEIERITEFIGEQRGYPDAYELPDCPEEGQDGGRPEISEGDRDSLFEEVARFVVSSQQGSTSSVQRKFKLGYNRAGRIIDQLEDAGIVGPLERNTREVRIKDPVALEQLLNADRSII